MLNSGGWYGYLILACIIADVVSGRPLSYRSRSVESEGGVLGSSIGALFGAYDS
jgi:hypothetical protein